MLFTMSYPTKDRGVAGREQTPGPLKQGAAAGKPGAATTQTRRQTRMSARSQPIDADDLRRRLYVVLTEQEASRQRKRHAKLEAPAAKLGEEEKAKERQRRATISTVKGTRECRVGNSSTNANGNDKTSDPGTALGVEQSSGTTPAAPYRHVPQVAASQFARTTTAEALNKKHIHRLSYPALHFHIDGKGRAEAESGNKRGGLLNPLRRVRSQREKVYERNQFQHSVSMDGGPAAEGRINTRQNRHTICVEPSSSNFSMRRTAQDYSTDEDSAHEVFIPDLTTANEHRVDWTQSDEAHETRKPTRGPLLHRVESAWALRGKIGNLIRHQKEERPAVIHEEDKSSSSTLPKSNRRGFLGRFKR
ncbi:hypothetical protein DL764_001139 [Monosporascus ibericus]|uniref:Uncharacterized protein n=1 Tax=Monosporascus ibericus TaxID=155417 RepID=A0A4Q4TVW1_9PEZI|nr:hypothetical protein DL764_001139 [Monosporascus ibericus]